MREGGTDELEGGREGGRVGGREELVREGRWSDTEGGNKGKKEQDVIMLILFAH